MKEIRQNRPEDKGRQPVVITPPGVAQNSNPAANENIRTGPVKPEPENPSSNSIGSEITDGEDA